ncbi:F0F1 ATP synthase subunit alpha [Verrucomicrobiota bacterium]
MTDIRIDTDDLAAVLEANAEKHAVEFGPEEVGHVLEAGDGIAHVDGLPGVMAEEMVLFPDGVYGMVMNLERDEVGVIILGDYSTVEQGDLVRRTCNVLRVPVGRSLLGRVVNPVGQPQDGKGALTCSEYREAETDAPGIAEREPISIPLQTGQKSIDAMTAIGRGQRELIIGDRQTGKTTLAVDTILNQVPEDVYCVYVAIGQKMSTVAGVVAVLGEHDRLSNCIVVVAAASDPAPLQYIAPFAGCAMAEFFRDQGKDALVVFDDLSKHAEAYREISLILRRPPGREAFPGDIFYLHSRLLERAGKLSSAEGGGSLTALPIIETKQGDYSAYIPTNLVSITDGQIYLETELFHQGFRPAVNVGLSVSRVGGKAQLEAMKKVALRLRLDLAQYREVASFAQLTSDVDAATMDQLHRGERLAEALKQEQHVPLPIEKEVFVIWAAVNGHLDDIPLDDTGRFEQGWLKHLDDIHPDIGRKVLETEEMSDEIEGMLVKAMEEFRRDFVVSGEVAAVSDHRVVPRADDQEERMSKVVLGTS